MANSIQLDPKRNSFGLIRLILALAVIYAHAYELGGFGDELIFRLSGNIYSIGAIAVDGFFALSGFLITASYLKINALPVFLWHRLLRIFPAYWIHLIVVAIGLPLLFAQSPDLGYALHNFLAPALSAFQVLLGVLMPLLLGWAPDLAGVAEKIPLLQSQNAIGSLFHDNPFPNAINGSLWTLGDEFRMYLLIGLLGFAGLLRRNVILTLLLLVWGFYCLQFHQHPDLRSVSSLRVAAHFLMGSVVCFWKPPLKLPFAVAALVVATIAFLGKFYPLVSPFTTLYLILWFGSTLPFAGFGLKRDYSYGLYIYAFPIQQALAAYHLNRWGLPLYLGLCTLLTFIPAILSWHLIEKQALSLKHLFSRRQPLVETPQPETIKV